MISRMSGKLIAKLLASLLLITQFVEVLCNDGSGLVSSADAVVRNIVSYSSFLIAGAIVVCLIVVLVGCADLRSMCASLCPQQTSFRDIDEDGYFNDIWISAAPNVQFSMYPPVESAPESRYSGSSVYFEPLPDVASRRRNQGILSANSTQMRPKVSQIGLGRMDSEEYEANEGGGGGQPYYNHSQELAKLEKLVTNSRNQFPRTQLQYIKEMGSGWFGKVLEGEGQGILPGHKKTKVVVQMLKEDADQHEKLTFLQEGLPYKEIQDQNVIKLFSHCVETNPFLMVLEYCPIDLKSFMKNNRMSVESFDKERLILNFACDIARGLQAIHQHNYVHRDFALRSCLVTADRLVKVGDYGLSEEFFKEDYYYDNNGDGIPIRWLAPEVISFSDDNNVVLSKITRDSNLWSYGVTLWELVKFGALPYTDLSNDNVLRLVVKERAVKLSKPDVPVSNVDKLYQLMQRCWLEPILRPSMRELLIMLLHLQTQTDQSDMSDFDQKWNQLMPRQNVDNLHSLSPYATADQNYAHSISNGTITTIAYSDGSDISGLPEVVIRPTSFGSEFSELNASLLAEAGSLQVSLRSASGTPDSPVRTMPDVKSPVNEMSLAAELNIAGGSFDKRDEDRDSEEEEGFDFLSGKSNGRLPSENLGNVNSSFLEEKSNVRGAVIQLQAEVHKTDGNRDRLMHTLGSVNRSFSVDLLSEEEETSPRTESAKEVEKAPPGDLRMAYNEEEEVEISRNDGLQRHNKENSGHLFGELAASTPKVSDKKKEDFPAMASDAQSESLLSYTGSVDQSSITHFEDRSFMQPHKYTSYLQTVTTSVEGDESEFAGGMERGEAYLGGDDEFGDFFDKLETKPSAAAAKAVAADELSAEEIMLETNKRSEQE